MDRADTRAARACAGARAALARGDARRAVDLADLGLNRAAPEDDGPALLCVRASAQLALGRAADAYASASRARALAREENAEPHALAAAAACALGRHEEAAAGYGRAVELEPGRAAWAAGHAAALLVLGRHADAAVAAEAALLADEGDVDARLVLGSLAMRGGRPDAAVAWLEPAAARATMRADVRATLAVALSASGDLARGLREYEWRSRLPNWNPRPFDIPGWRGEPLAGKRLLVWDEQGLGDTLQFVRFTDGARRLGARTIFHGEPRLCRLLGSCRGLDEVVARHRPRPRADLHASVMSLPALLGASATDDVGQPVPYLAAEPTLGARWAARLAHDGDQRPIVALAWQGNPGFCDDERRSLRLATLLPLVRAHGRARRFVSLQKGFGQDQLQLLPDDAPVEDLGAALDQGSDAFVDSAAALAEVDLLITSDTALAHLAGALGRPVWLLLARVPDWRWGTAGAHTPWYPSMRLFRQSATGDWPGVVTDVVGALSAR